MGLVAITDVQNARAQYDTVLANEVTARNNLDNAVEQLRQITGNYYPELAALNVENFKTDKPQPVNTLLKEAEKTQPVVVTGAFEPGPGARANSPGAGWSLTDSGFNGFYRDF